MADAILDHIGHHTHRLTLQGEAMRKSCQILNKSVQQTSHCDNQGFPVLVMETFRFLWSISPKYLAGLRLEASTPVSHILF